jgi:hypothetical protein
MFASILLLGVGVIARWYMLPVLTLGALVVALAIKWSFPAKTRLPIFAVGVFALVIGAGAPLLVERLFIDPILSYHSSSIKFLDLWRAECLTRDGEVADLSQREPRYFPNELVILEEKSICTDFNPNVWNTVKDALPGVTRVRLPANADEVAALNSAWQEAWATDAPTLVYARFGLAQNLLGLSEFWMTLGEEEKIATGEARLTIARAPANLLAAGETLGNVLRNGAIYVVCFPIVLLAVILAKKLRPPGWVYLGLAIPIAWVVNFVSIGPANDTRYISTAVGWSIIFSFIVVAERARFKRKV